MIENQGFWISTSISIISLSIAILHFWIAFLHRGKVVMTRPNIVCISYLEGGTLSVLMRFFLRSTSQKGQIIEDMYIKIRMNNKPERTFSRWSKGAPFENRRSGFFVSDQGIEELHVFSATARDSDFSFEAGKIQIGIYIVKKGKVKKMYDVVLHLRNKQLTHLDRKILNIAFDWNPEQREYDCIIESPTMEKLAQLLA